MEDRNGAEELAEYEAEVIEEGWEDGFVFELDNSYDALHRSLTDGTLDAGGGEFPLNAVVYGRESLTQVRTTSSA